MARPQKNNVDYFPHACVHGQTMFILEQRFGNDGYAFWFKLLEILGNIEGHYLDLNDDYTWEFLQAKTHLSGDFCDRILDLLAKLQAIDKKLWENRVIWCQKFVDGIAQVYSNRKQKPPQRPSFYDSKPRDATVSTPESTQRKEKKRKEKKSTKTCIGKSDANSFDFNSDNSNNPDNPDNPDISWFENEFWPKYPSRNGRKPGKTEARKAYQSVRKKKDWPGEESVLAALIAQIEHKQWCDEQGKFCPEFPDPERWLKKKRWEDEIEQFLIRDGPLPANQKQGMPDDVVFPDPKCPICNGKGAIMQPDGSTRPCTCFKKREELKPDDREAAISLPTFRSGS